MKISKHNCWLYKSKSYQQNFKPPRYAPRSPLYHPYLSQKFLKYNSNNLMVHTTNNRHKNGFDSISLEHFGTGWCHITYCDSMHRQGHSPFSDSFCSGWHNLTMIMIRELDYTCKLIMRFSYTSIDWTFIKTNKKNYF